MANTLPLTHIIFTSVDIIRRLERTYPCLKGWRLGEIKESEERVMAVSKKKVLVVLVGHVQYSIPFEVVRDVMIEMIEEKGITIENKSHFRCLSYGYEGIVLH